MDEPKRRWWRRKRWIAAAILAAAAGYPLSFVPACWMLIRLDQRSLQAGWAVVCEAYRPAASVLAVCPEDVQHVVCGIVNVGRTDRAALVAGGGRIGVRSRETDGGRDTVVIRWVW